MNGGIALTSRIPMTAITLMTNVYRKIFPAVAKELAYWEECAKAIPDKELRTQALASIASKRFHCQGGAVYALLAGNRWRTAVRFIVAYQTISDYLDNLCDRSTSLDPDDFRLLHESMHDALTLENKMKNYYALRIEQDDGNYLINLVRACQQVLTQIPKFSTIQQVAHRLEGLYADLQVHKHVAHAERIPRLKRWYEAKRGDFSSLSWFEFSAAAGSTLGIFCLVSYALDDRISKQLSDNVVQGYFPFIQGLHILLDYFIDQDEDRNEADLNFCSYYTDFSQMRERLLFFIERAHSHIQILPDRPFHEMILHGLLGLYLADPKVEQLQDGVEMKKALLRRSGKKARFFHWNTKMYYKLKGS